MICDSCGMFLENYAWTDKDITMIMCEICRDPSMGRMHIEDIQRVFMGGEYKKPDWGVRG